METVKTETVMEELLPNGNTAKLTKYWFSYDKAPKHQIDICQGDKEIAHYYITVWFNGGYFDIGDVDGDNSYNKNVLLGLFEDYLTNFYEPYFEELNTVIDEISYHVSNLNTFALTNPENPKHDNAVAALEFIYGANSQESIDYMTWLGDEELSTDEELKDYLDQCNSYNCDVVKRAVEKAENTIVDLMQQYNFY